MIYEPIKKLIDFVDSDEQSSDTIILAMKTFFRGIQEEYGCDTIKDVGDLLGDEAFDVVYPVMLEFFFSNVYGETGDWNVIDHFMKSKQAKKLEDYERNYLNAIRNSNMSVYKVTAIKPDTSITLKDMMEENSEITVKEKMATRSLKKGDYVGLRIVGIENHKELAGAALKFEKKEGLELVNYLENMHSTALMMTRMANPDLDDQYIEHYAKVMWAVEIAEHWMLKRLGSAYNIFENMDYDEASKEEIVEFVNSMKDEHYRKWMRTRIPALDNKTPRMAKRTKKGTVKLVSLFLEMQDTENKAARKQGLPPYDMRWMWQELNLEEEVKALVAA